jgi:hypothetical protein
LTADSTEQEEFPEVDIEEYLVALLHGHQENGNTKMDFNYLDIADNKTSTAGKEGDAVPPSTHLQMCQHPLLCNFPKNPSFHKPAWSVGLGKFKFADLCPRIYAKFQRVNASFQANN